MFAHFFGNYLIKKGMLTKAQFSEILKKQQAVRVKLGLIAVSEGLLTEKQAHEINRLQATLDKRFGDIAVERNYLTEEQVSRLLSLQGNPYLQFLQTVTDFNYLTNEDFDTLMQDYQKENGFTAHDINAIKSGDIDLIAPVFVHIDAPFYNQYIGLSLRNIIRFIRSDIYIEQAYSVDHYSFETLSAQYMDGDYEVFAGFAASGDSLLAMAEPFAGEAFDSVDEDAFDSVCEFINCINGLFASALSHEGTELDMLPPVYYKNRTLYSTGKIYVVPIYFNGTRIDLLISIDSKVDIK